jgi:hypothetical protein
LATHLNQSRGFRLHLSGTEFWSGDRGLTLVTISLVLFIFVILPLQKAGLPGRFLFDVVMLGLMVSGALTVGTNRVITAFAVAVLLTATVALWVSLVYPTPVLHRASSFLSIAAFLFYARIVLLVMFRSGRVTWSRIQGGISAYMLLGLVWASAFELIEHFSPGAFRFISQPADVEQLSAKLVYFSFCTLTTVGFGDVTPVHPLARSLAIAEALTGQLFPAILIGALVAMAVHSHTES